MLVCACLPPPELQAQFCISILTFGYVDFSPTKTQAKADFPMVMALK
jgi:hypothetical protein